MLYHATLYAMLCVMWCLAQMTASSLAAHHLEASRPPPWTIPWGGVSTRDTRAYICIIDQHSDIEAGWQQECDQADHLGVCPAVARQTPSKSMCLLARSQLQAAQSDVAWHFSRRFTSFNTFGLLRLRIWSLFDLCRTSKMVQRAEEIAEFGADGEPPLMKCNASKFASAPPFSPFFIRLYSPFRFGFGCIFAKVCLFLQLGRFILSWINGIVRVLAL